VWRSLADQGYSETGDEDGVRLGWIRQGGLHELFGMASREMCGVDGPAIPLAASRNRPRVRGFREGNFDLRAGKEYRQFVQPLYRRMAAQKKACEWFVAKRSFLAENFESSWAAEGLCATSRSPSGFAIAVFRAAGAKHADAGAMRESERDSVDQKTRGRRPSAQGIL